MWNSLPTDTVNSKTVVEFKTKLDKGGEKWLLDDWLVLGQTGFQTISFSFGSCMVTFDTEHL